MKFRNLFFVLFLFASQFSFAHKNRVYVETCGSVKIRMVTPFDYAESDKIKILAKFSNEIAKSLNELDTIFIRYNHKNPAIRKNECLLDYTETRFSVEEKQKVVLIELFDDNLDIEQILILVEFSIKNKRDLDKYKIKMNFYSYETLFKGDEYFITSPNFINSLFYFNSENGTSELILNLMKNEVCVIDNNNFKVIWRNSEYFWYNKIDLNKCILKVSDKDLFSYQFLDKGVLIFKNSNCFNYYKNKGTISKEHIIDNKDGYNVFQFTRKESEELFNLSSFSGSNRYKYFIKEDKLVKNEK